MGSEMCIRDSMEDDFMRASDMRHCPTAHRVTAFLVLRAHKMDSPQGRSPDGHREKIKSFTED